MKIKNLHGWAKFNMGVHVQAIPTYREPVDPMMPSGKLPPQSCPPTIAVDLGGYFERVLSRLC